MNKAQFSNTLDKYGTVPQACDYFKLSRNTLMQILDGTDAIKRFGKSVRVDISTATKILDSYVG